MNKILGYAALIVFVVSAVVHFSTYVPSVPITMGDVWPLHLLAMAAGGAMIFAINRKEKTEQKGTKKRFTWPELSAPFPFVLRVACVFAGIYAVVNFVLFIALMEGGSPAKNKGTYSLQNHGRVIRFLSAQEYQRFQAYEVRGFSGHWMLFSIIPAAYFFSYGPRKIAGKTE